MLKYADLAKLGKTGWKQYLFSIFLILFFYLFVGVIVSVIVTLVNTGNTNSFIEYISINLTIICMLIGLFLSINYIHKRKFITLITPHEKIRWSRIIFGFSIFLILMIVFNAIEYFVHPNDFKLTVDINTFLVLPIVIIVTILQTTTEELFYRGYIIQLFGLFLKNNILLAFISGFIFTLPHLWNPELQNGLYAMILTYFTYGFLLSIVTLRSNTLEIAIGVHAANNLFCFVFVDYENSVSPLNSLFTITHVYPVFSLIMLIIQALIFYYIVVKYIGKSVDNTEKSTTIIG